MLYDLREPLTGIIPESQLDMFEEACQTMELFKYYDTASQLSLFVEGSGNYEPIYIQANIRDIIEENLILLLNSFEVVMEFDIVPKVMALKAIHFMENSDQSESIVEMINFGESTRDSFLELLGYFSGRTADYFFPYLVGEPESLINRLFELHQPRADLGVEHISDVNEVSVTRTRKFLEQYHQTLTHDALYIEQYKPGVDDMLLFDKYNADLSRLYPRALDQLSVEIVGLLCLSGVPSKDFGMQVKKKLDLIVPDKFEAARMTTIVDNITMRLGIYA